MTDKPKRKRGRPKKQPVKVPTFENDNDIRQFLINESLRLNVELIETATKKNNIKNPTVSRAKAFQYKTALEGLKITNTLLKDKQINEIQTKLKLMEEGLTASLLTEANDETETNKNISNAVAELTKINDEIAILKGSD